MSTIYKVIATVFLTLVGLVGLAMSLCGGYVTLASLPDVADHAGEMPRFSLLPISVPSLLVGLALVGFVAWRFKKWEERERSSRWRAPHDDRR